ncbi:hypothetical protein EVG20_g1715 [Dentipellis fragilis]|uniref:Uncharacterized protein n=1 Tax=Dentipellis fragilis TaxID=205917 RepID=A0A4Y9ZBA6_9AGAM|nr:hypothetical protein EVG20_g1715 [Dentipellis fragilis]
MTIITVPFLLDDAPPPPALPLPWCWDMTGVLSEYLRLLQRRTYVPSCQGHNHVGGVYHRGGHIRPMQPVHDTVPIPVAERC